MAVHYKLFLITTTNTTLITSNIETPTCTSVTITPIAVTTNNPILTTATTAAYSTITTTNRDN